MVVLVVLKQYNMTTFKFILLANLLFLYLPTSFSQLLDFGGQNDAERMQKSPASKELKSMESKEYYYRHFRDEYNKEIDELSESYFERSEIQKQLDQTKKAYQDFKKYYEEAKAKDPKFKWDKMKTNYPELIEKHGKELALLEEEYEKMMECADSCSDINHYVSELLKFYDSTPIQKWREKALKIDLSSFDEMTAKFEGYDIRKKPYLQKAKKLVNVEFPTWVNENLVNEVDSYVEKFQFGEALSLIEGCEHIYPEFDQYDALKQKIQKATEEKELADKQKEEERIKKEQERIANREMPVKTGIMNSSTEKMAVDCAVEELGDDPDVIKYYSTGSWAIERHTYTNEIENRTGLVVFIVKENDKCYVYSIKVLQNPLANGGWEDPVCLTVEKDWFSVDTKKRGKPYREQILCNKVK